jgi:hypothetical protein
MFQLCAKGQRPRSKRYAKAEIRPIRLTVCPLEHMDDALSAVYNFENATILRQD